MDEVRLVRAIFDMNRLQQSLQMRGTQKERRIQGTQIERVVQPDEGTKEGLEEKDKYYLGHFPRGSSEQARQGIAMQRKVFRRRQSQEERSTVIELFKELFQRMNQSMVGNHPEQGSKEQPSRSHRVPKTKSRIRSKQTASKGTRDIKDNLHRPTVQNKRDILANYAVVMNYEIFTDSPERPQSTIKPVSP